MESRRIMGLIAAVVLALVGTLAIVAYVKGAEDRAQAGERIVKVLVVQDTVPAGTPATELGDRVDLEEVNAKVMADGAVTSVKALGDTVAGTTLLPGEQVIENRFVPKSNYSATGADVQVPPGLLKVSVALDPERVIGGVLTPGAKVAVLASFDPFKNDSGAPMEIDGFTVEDGKSTPNTTKTILQKVLVTNVQLTGSVNSNEETSDDNTASTNKPGEAPKDQLIVTLALDVHQSEQLVFTKEFGRVWLAIEPTDADESKTQVTHRGNVQR